MANVIVLAPTSTDDSILMYTFFPYTAEHCENVLPIVYNEFNGTFIQNVPIFPEKFQNLFRCPLKVATYNFPPFVMLTGMTGPANKYVHKRVC